MYTSYLKKYGSLLVVATFLCSFINFPVEPTNFSGTWTLNEGKSELGQFGARGVASKMVVEQKGEDVTITRTSSTFQGDEVTSTETLTADGKTTESTVFGSSKKKATLKWAADGKTFVITFSVALEMNGQSFDLSGTETWSLSDDGKSVSLKNALSTPQGDIETKVAYDKQ